MDKKKVFVSAYVCEPGRGSEVGVGWNWVMQMSKHYKLWVMTRESNRENIEEWFSNHPNENQIDFVYYDLPEKYRTWKKGEKGVRKYYCLWQKSSDKLVRECMEKNDIDTYHLITFGNALWPASKYGMKKKFVWGPIGGIEAVEKEYVNDYSSKVRSIEFARRAAVKMLGLNCSYKKRCKNADKIICKSEVVKNNIPKKYRDKAVVRTDVAVDEINELVVSDNETLKVFAAGRLDGWRGFNLLIEAFKDTKNMTLQIAGDGVAKEDLIEMAKDNPQIEMLGQISKEDYKKHLSDADIIVNPVLREGGVTLVYDALANGKPLICIDTKGYTKEIREAAVVIEKTNRKDIVRKLAENLEKLKDVARRKELGTKAIEWAKDNTWDKKDFKILDE